MNQQRKYSVDPFVSRGSISHISFFHETSALDSKSEKLVVEALNTATERTRCMLMVTHRLGVVRSLGVNKVVVLEQGEIVEMGHPEDLLRSGGVYSQLAAEQGIRSLGVDATDTNGQERNLSTPYL